MCRQMLLLFVKHPRRGLKAVERNVEMTGGGKPEQVRNKNHVTHLKGHIICLIICLIICIADPDKQTTLTQDGNGGTAEEKTEMLKVMAPPAAVVGDKNMLDNCNPEDAQMTAVQASFQKETDI